MRRATPGCIPSTPRTERSGNQRTGSSTVRRPDPERVQSSESERLRPPPHLFGLLRHRVRGDDPGQQPFGRDRRTAGDGGVRNVRPSEAVCRALPGRTVRHRTVLPHLARTALHAGIPTRVHHSAATTNGRPPASISRISVSTSSVRSGSAPPRTRVVPTSRRASESQASGPRPFPPPRWCSIDRIQSPSDRSRAASARTRPRMLSPASGDQRGT